MPGIPGWADFFWVGASVIAVILVARHLSLSTHGRALYAIRDDEVAASEVVEMDDPIEVALRRKRDSSMRVAIQLLKADREGTLLTEMFVPSTIARDLASARVRVCTIAPGLFLTPLLASLAGAEPVRESTRVSARS